MAVAKSAGSFLGGITNNLGFVGIALGLGALFIFRDKISEFFQSGLENLGNIDINLPEINFPEINLPEINFPEFNFPEINLPNFENPFPNAVLDNAGDVAILPLTDPALNLPNPFDDPTNPTQVDIDLSAGIPLNPPLTENLPVGFNPERTGVSFGTEIIVPAGDEFNLGGGSGFIGGTTTLGDNLVDTLSEVFRAFPDLTASQAADTLAANPNLTQTQFALINPDVINLSNEIGDPFNQQNNASGGFMGLTPTQIAQLLTGGNINNF